MAGHTYTFKNDGTLRYYPNNYNLYGLRCYIMDSADNGTTAKGNYVGLSHMDFTTSIDGVTDVIGDFEEDGRVYNINGQLMTGRQLSPGIYVKNGKKFVVK